MAIEHHPADGGEMTETDATAVRTGADVRQRVRANARAAERRQGRDANGRFAPGSGLSFHKGWTKHFEEMLGADLPAPAGELGRKAHRLYRALLSELPVQSVSICSLVAQRARAATLADVYARLALCGGPKYHDTQKWLATAHKWDKRAEQLANTILEQATKLTALASEHDERPVITVDALAEAAKPRGQP